MDFNFPIIKNVSGKLLSNDLISVSPKTVEELANGRPIKPYPFKYSSFNSAEDLKNYIEDILHMDKKLSADWLSAGEVSHLPLNIRDDVYYTPISSFNITCYKPTENIQDDIIEGRIICELKPDDVLIEEADKILEDIKKMFKKD